MRGLRLPHCSNAISFIYIMFRLSLARHVYFWVVHAQLRTHGGMVLSWDVLIRCANIW